MTIRSKLIVGYGGALLVAIIVGASSLLALVSWRESANTLAHISSQRALSERIRAELLSLTNDALEFSEGEQEYENTFWQADKQIDSLLQSLKDSALTEIESEHIQGLRETHDELVWIMRGNIKERLNTATDDAARLKKSQLRLEEITEEVTDDVDVLNQFYRDESEAAFALANTATTRTTYIIVAVVIASVLTLLLAIFLLRRWLSTPIIGISKATAAISSGDFTVRAPDGANDEWGKLGADINRMAQSLRLFETRLRDQERLAALGEVAAYAAHNIRNPLAGVRAAAQVMQVDLPQSESRAHDTLIEMIACIDRLDIWVQHMMTFAQPLAYQPSPIDINATITATTLVSRNSIKAKHIQLDLNLHETLPTVSADSSLLEQAYSAILNNAIDAVSDAGRIVISSDTVANNNGSRDIRVTFTDNGPGVSAEMRGKLFRLFASGKDNGSGLGLAQAKRIFEAHKGTISLEDIESSGCTVVTQLPINDYQLSSDK
ncbi:HAMP domain-containing protein [bacterium AH-315-J21]|nr:HAMP domain-containing protein [bacterium AH-315-J21]